MQNPIAKITSKYNILIKWVVLELEKSPTRMIYLIFAYLLICIYEGDN